MVDEETGTPPERPAGSGSTPQDGYWPLARPTSSVFAAMLRQSNGTPAGRKVRTWKSKRSWGGGAKRKPPVTKLFGD